jgi:hypothetical protein
MFVSDVQKSLGEDVGATPAKDPQRLVGSRFDSLNEKLAPLTQGDVVADSCFAVYLANTCLLAMERSLTAPPL